MLCCHPAALSDHRAPAAFDASRPELTDIDRTTEGTRMPQGSREISVTAAETNLARACPDRRVPASMVCGVASNPKEPERRRNPEESDVVR
jgi:hypothetical protein